MGPRNHVLGGVEIPHSEGHFLGVVWPIEKHWESVLQCMLQKNHSVVNKGIQHKGSFNHQ